MVLGNAPITPLPAESVGSIQGDLFAQIMRANRIALLMTLGFMAALIVFPAARSLPIMLLVGVVLGEWFLTEYCLTQLRSVPRRDRAGVFIVVTMLLATIAAVVLRSPAFIATMTALLIVLSALLVTPHLAIVPAVFGFAAFCTLVFAESQGWRNDAQIASISSAFLAINSTFSGAALAIIVVISMMFSRRFQQSIQALQARANEAEHERQIQVQLTTDLVRQVEEQQRLLGVIHDLEIPVMPVAYGVVVLPLIGRVDSTRAHRIEQRLLDVVFNQHAQVVVLDLTGMPLLDAASVQWIAQLTQAVRLIGCQAILSGLSPAAAQMFVQVRPASMDVLIVATLADAVDRALHTSSGYMAGSGSQES